MQVKTRRITISAIVGSAAFQAGVKDFHDGVVNFGAWDNGEWVWHYERGRLFAATCLAAGKTVPASRQGRYVSPSAIRAVSDTFRARDIL